MPQGKFHASPLQTVHQVQKAGKLAHGIVLIAVGGGKVGKDTLCLQAGQRGSGGNFLHGPLQVGPIAEKAQTGHAGVRFHMNPQPFSHSCRCG